MGQFEDQNYDEHHRKLQEKLRKIEKEKAAADEESRAEAAAEKKSEPPEDPAASRQEPLESAKLIKINKKALEEEKYLKAPEQKVEKSSFSFITGRQVSWCHCSDCRSVLLLARKVGDGEEARTRVLRYQVARVA